MKILIKKTVLELRQGDITTQSVDAIVNAANTRLAGGGGVDGAIHRAGGPAIMEACRKIGGCPAGQAVITTGGKIPARFVIHTVGPVYRDGASGEPEILSRAYGNSLKTAAENGVRTIAFPSISTGAYGYPVKDASRVALSTVIDYIMKGTTIERITFVLFSPRDCETYRKALQELNSSQATSFPGPPEKPAR